MFISGYLSLVVCLVGLVLYLITEKPKPSQIGWHMFLWGMVIFLYCNCGAHFQAGVTGK